MDKNKIIILVLIAIIVALLVGGVAMMSNMNKQDTKLTFMSNSTIDEGDSIEIKLTDNNGNLLVNQTVNVTVTDSNKTSSYYSVVTNETGFGVLKLDKSAGEYDVIINYGGNDQYNGCNATQKLTIKEEEKVVESQSTSTSGSSSSSSSSNKGNSLNYDSELNVYYDGNGRVVDPDGYHGQGVGMRYSDVVEWSKTNPDME